MKSPKPEKTAPPTPDLNIGKILPQPLVKEVQDSYLDYAMSVIISRALPDVRDGLKPVHRRILYAMWDMGLKPQAKFRKSATVVGECFVKDTLILTEKGMTPIQEIRVKDQVYTQQGLQKVTRLYEIPKHPLLKVVLENGLSNIVTFSQKFKVLTPDWQFEWKEAKDLTKDDYLVIKADYPEISSFVKLTKIEKKQPNYLNQNIAYLLGLFVSEGSIPEDYGKKLLPRISFGISDKNIAKKIVSILEQEFNYKPTIEVAHSHYQTKIGQLAQNRYTVRINRKSVNEFFNLNFGLKGKRALTKEIPPQIFCSPKNIIFSFISGLVEGDGSISLKRNCIHYGSISEKLIDQLMVLFLSQGIFSSKYTDDNLKREHFVLGRKVQSKHKFYYLEVRSDFATKLASKLALINKIKNSRAYKLSSKETINNERMGWSKHDLIPYAGNILFHELSRRHLGGGWYQDVNNHKFRMGIEYPTGCKIRYSSDLLEKPLRKTQVIDWGIKEKLERIGSPLLEFIENIISNKIHFLRVSAIQKLAPQKTYDFEVENDHEFIANGVVSHNCLGKYHPHGDVAVYDSLVRLAQDFSLRYPLVSGQGNFGSLDGDSAAAMRYTECKLASISEEVLADIDRETVNFVPNYDGVHQEPTVLPAKLPNLLLNGTMGIAVGMATNIPPHHLGEVCDAIIHLIDHPDADVEDLVEFIKGPDFPTGAIIYDKKEITQAYATGRGRIVTRAKTEIVEDRAGIFKIIVSEIPYQVNKAALVEKIAELVHSKKIEGIKDLRDESNKDGVRLVIELKKDAYPKKILNQLFNFTQLQETFHLNMLALVDGLQPRVLNLKNILEEYFKHRQTVVKRRAEFDLKKAQERAHILKGLKIALDNIDAVIKTIKQSQDKDEAKINLIKKFRLTEIQAGAILEMKLQQLANLERKKIEDELKEKIALIKELETILASPKRIRQIIKSETEELKKKFADERRTQVIPHGVKEFSMEDLVPNEDTIVAITRDGYLKRLPPETFRTQARGGKGVIGITTKEEDVVEHLFSTTTHADLLFFSTRGRVFQLKAYDVPVGSRTSKGQAIVNFLQLAPQEKVSAVLSLTELGDYKYLVMVTRQGVIKKVDIKDFANVRRSGLIALKLKGEDILEWVKPSTGADEIMLITSQGQSIRFKEKNVRAMGRNAAGVRGMRLKGKDFIVGMDIVDPAMAKNFQLFVISEEGLGKRTPLPQYRLQGRGGSGIKTAKVTAKTGKLIGAYVVNAKDERDLMVVSDKGQVIRLPFGTVSVLGRATQGVRLMRFKEPGDKVASVTLV